jgi:NADH-quinone oxidoreductase subunit F
VDLRFSGEEPSAAERAAVDAVLGAAQGGWDGGEREIARDGRTALAGVAASGRRDLLLPALHALQDRAGWVSPGGLQYVCRRLSVPPAEAWGVVTFYDLLATEPRPPIVAHVCDDLACRLAGAERICARLAESIGPAGSPAPGGRSTWTRSPCLGQCEKAPAVLVVAAGERPAAGVLAPVGDATDVAAALAAATAGAAREETRDTSVSKTKTRDVPLKGVAGGAPGAGAEAAAESPTAPQPPHSSTAGLSPFALSSSLPLPLPFPLSLTAGFAPLTAVEDTSSPVARSVPQAGDPDLRLLRRVGVVDPTNLAAYRAAGGYRALARAIEQGPERVIEEVVTSRLVGRGGAAFPTGRKWEAVARAAGPKFLIANADESEPGTFKDRILLEHDPFAIVEAMTIAAFATGCERGFVYLRGEYPLAWRRLDGALAQARAAGLLGADVAGAGFRFDIEIRRGAGAYICGEETALFNSIEGRRGEPRSKPPFPTESGLFGRPTVVNNVETLANVPWIVLDGGAGYAGIGTDGSSGTKLFCVCGHVARPGLYETRFEATLGELLELAGGVAGGRGFRAVLLGGAAGAFVGPESIGLPLTFEATRAAGVTLGSGVVMVFDEDADLGDALLRIAQFFRHESCGQCVPCRVGTVRQEELLRRLRDGRTLNGHEEEIALLRELAEAMRDASICGLGQTASAAIESAFERFDPFPRPAPR